MERIASTVQMDMLETECANRVFERNLSLTEKRLHIAAAPNSEPPSNETCSTGRDVSRRRHVRFIRTHRTEAGPVSPVVTSTTVLSSTTDKPPDI